ncbi:MAG: hypothetical protein MUF49_19780 [Oculatellaceae cyanobacterium Prado106]|nr:hypothetical protein [Oculatellaceae cyanobacterium Prado106]
MAIATPEMKENSLIFFYYSYQLVLVSYQLLNSLSKEQGHPWSKSGIAALIQTGID